MPMTVTDNPIARNQNVESWRRLAEVHAHDDGVPGSLARALATAVQLMSEPRVRLDRIGVDRVELVDRWSGSRQVVVGSALDVIAHATVFCLGHGGVIEIDAVIDPLIAEYMISDGHVNVVKTRSTDR